MKPKATILTALCAMILASCSGGTDKQVEELKQGFANPPQESRIQVWWHWMDGNVTKEGVRKDLEWMHRVGIGGFHHFDAALTTPQSVDKRLIYMDEGWKDAFAYAIHLADSLGLEVTVASAPGWSATGGPWVSPQDAMKKLVWRTETITGGSHYSGTMPAPFSTTGAFQNAPVEGRGEASADRYYEDIAVIAMRLPEGDMSMREMGATVTSSSGSFSVDRLSNDDLTDGTLLRNERSGNAWIQFAFPEERTIRAVSLCDGRGGRGMGGSSVWIEAGNDGRNFTKVADLATGSAALRTVSIAPTTAKYFRVVYRNTGGPGRALALFRQAPDLGGTMVSELVLHSASRVNRAEDKAAFTAVAQLATMPTPAPAGEAYASTSDVVNITECMSADGKLEWDAPEGRWKIWRFGWSLTGKQNHPAPPEATGLEVDKLDPAAWTRYFRTYLDMYKEASGGLLGKHGIQYVLNDSYEAEQENWTPAMFNEFRTRRGYDLTPWLPVLTGTIVGSPEQSDAFLYDWRKTIGELITANYELLTEIAVGEYGMLGRYTEAHEGGRVYPVDGMDVKKGASVPMSAMWVVAPWLGRNADGSVIRSGYMSDCQESASVAHIYGQNIAAAESMTAWGNVQYSYSPQNLKETADLELAMGINRFVIHESAHQPSDTYVPGHSLGGIGQWFNRHDAWAEQAGVWVDYLSRSSYMLQAGHNVADILVYYGEDANITALYGGRQPALPHGYNFDYLNPHGLLNQIYYKKGQLASLSGTRYEVLWLERNTEVMSLDVLRKIAELADEGAVIVGPRPLRPAGLMDSKDEFKALVASVWDSGKKNVYEKATIAEVLTNIAVTPDFVADSAGGMRFLHRSLDGAEIYWVNKPTKDYRKVEASFRVSGMKPMVWHPEDGRIEEVSYRTDGDRTVVSLDMVPEDAVFVVFSGKGEVQHTVPAVKKTEIASVQGPWKVDFQAGRGAPESAVFPALESYTASDEFGIKYFCGEADYNNIVALPATEGRVWIELGAVGNLAEVYLNGKYCGTAWKEPFRVDITDAVTEGENELQIKVVNLWVNRLIGDEQPDCPQKITFTDARHYTADTPLLPSGLMGPVRIVEEVE